MYRRNGKRHNNGSKYTVYERYHKPYTMCFFSGILLKKTLQKFLQHLFEDYLFNQKIKTESLKTVSPVDFKAANFLFKVQNLQQHSFSVDTLFKFVSIYAFYI